MVYGERCPSYHKFSRLAEFVLIRGYLARGCRIIAAGHGYGYRSVACTARLVHDGLIGS